MQTATRRSQVINLYKQMLLIARDYPGKSYAQARNSIHRAFIKNAHLQDAQQIDDAINKAQYILKEMETLVYLARYRELKRRYYAQDENAEHVNSGAQQTMEVWRK